MPRLGLAASWEGIKPTQPDPRCPEAAGFPKGHLGLTVADGPSLPNTLLSHPPPAREGPCKPPLGPVGAEPRWSGRIQHRLRCGDGSSPLSPHFFHHVDVFFG